MFENECESENTSTVHRKETVLEKHMDRGIQQSVFQDPDKLHLTLCTMVLCDDYERGVAAQVLQKCKTEIIDNILCGQPLRLRVRGIEIMNDDPAEANVIYGTIHCDDEERLQTLADSIVNYCSKAGIVSKEYEKVKLHITLMNTKFRKSEISNENNRRGQTMNAVNLLQVFKNYDFGEEIVNAIHLSQMGTVSRNDGYYKSSVVLNIL